VSVRRDVFWFGQGLASPRSARCRFGLAIHSCYLEEAFRSAALLDEVLHEGAGISVGTGGLVELTPVRIRVLRVPRSRLRAGLQALPGRREVVLVEGIGEPLLDLRCGNLGHKSP